MNGSDTYAIAVTLAGGRGRREFWRAWFAAAWPIRDEDPDYWRPKIRQAIREAR